MVPDRTRAAWNAKSNTSLLLGVMGRSISRQPCAPQRRIELSCQIAWCAVSPLARQVGHARILVRAKAVNLIRSCPRRNQLSAVRRGVHPQARGQRVGRRHLPQALLPSRPYRIGLGAARTGTGIEPEAVEHAAPTWRGLLRLALGPPRIPVLALIGTGRRAKILRKIFVDLGRESRGAVLDPIPLGRGHPLRAPRRAVTGKTLARNLDLAADAKSFRNPAPFGKIAGIVEGGLHHAPGRHRRVGPRTHAEALCEAMNLSNLRDVFRKPESSPR